MARIAHVAPWGPNTAGIFEAARDMMKADVTSGHTVYYVDRGNLRDGKFEYVPYGTEDDRPGLKIVTSPPSELDHADLIVAHTMPHHEWLSKNQTPVIFVVHGRPLYSFRLEYMKENSFSYTYIHDIANYPRVKKMLYFWSEFKPFWYFPEEKDLCLDYPIIDQIRFSPEGEKHIIEDKHRGEYNILICDSWREDVDMFEIFNGAIQVAKELKNIKFHLYAAETKDGKLKPCWQFLIQELRKLNAMGELSTRMTDMEQRYRAMDAVLTPHRIVTRVIGEALSCGVPVIADEKCKIAQFGCDPHDPISIAGAIKKFIFSDKKEMREKAISVSKRLSHKQYSQRMNRVYKEILGS